MIIRLVTAALLLCSMAYQARSQEAGDHRAQIAIFGDIENRAKVTDGKELAQLAKEQIAAGLVKTGRYSLVPPEEIVRAAKELDIRPPYLLSDPFDNAPLTRLGARLQTDTVISGELVFVRLDKKGCNLGLVVRITEPETGDYLQCEAGLGTVKAMRQQGDESTLKKEALTKAVEQIIKSLMEIPEGVVISRTDDRIRISLGHKDHMRKGLEVAIYRDRKRIGRGRITAVYPTESDVQITQSSEKIQPKDVIHMICFPPRPLL